jgi:hypothetical protein
MRSRRRRPLRPTLEPLDPRTLLSALPGIAPAPAPQAAETQDIQATEFKKKKFKATSITIFGTLLPAPIVTKGKLRGAVVVAGKVVWQLDLTAFKGYDVYAQQLLQKPVVVWGTIVMSTEPDGSLKRKIQVGWMEPLKYETINGPRVKLTQINGKPKYPNPRPRG